MKKKFFFEKIEKKKKSNRGLLSLELKLLNEGWFQWRV